MAHIAVLTISRGNPRIEYCAAYGALNRHPDIATYLMPASMYVDTQRNMLWEVARNDGPHDWYVWIDDDHGFTVDQVRAICATEYPVATGLYYSAWREGRFPVLYDIDDGNFPHVTCEHVNAQFDPFPVEICGAGFMAVRADVVEAMVERYSPIEPWFHEPIAYNKKLGEDFGFCLRLREMGIPIHAIPTVIVQHIKTMAI